MQHMFSFKARHYLPAFLLASAFPRDLCMSSCWQSSVLAITLENQESGLLLKFQQPEWMPALSRLQKLTVPRSLALVKPAGGVGGWQTPFSKSYVHITQLPFSWSYWVSQGEGPWGSPILKTWMGQSQFPSPFSNPGKLLRDSKMSLLPKTSGFTVQNSLFPVLQACLLWLQGTGLKC